MGDLTQMRIVDFVEAVAAKKPTPGGGSVSAAAAALGAALGIMAARFSKPIEAAEGAAILEEIKTQLVELVDADGKAYDLVDAAIGLPRETEEEQSRRSEAIQNSLGDAAAVPLKGMEHSVAALDSLKAMVPHINKNLISDLASAAYLLEAGMKGCEMNVLINARSIKDRKVGGQLKREAEALSKRGKALASSMLREVHKRNDRKK